MYALFPAFVSSSFLFYGVSVVTTRGRTRAILAFPGMTTLTSLWQGIWAFLFQSQDVGAAQVLAKIGWIAILVMPTMLYHFAVEVAEAPGERRWLVAAYALDAMLIALLLTTNLVIDGVYQFLFGFYPKAGVLEAVHIVQTAALVTRGMWVLYREQQHATAEKRKRLLTCLVGVGLISLAAADYAVNYGMAFYPPAV
ncbi:histidine kinase N-terminal 7TM domain-containing protein, partial [Burkholderia cenocepacia]|uniref:histidine kinase N-terminal 7TM domain-containing protein n=1 Tax=Burkholderia cenocepacia TaxID=95486 RepID=UPI00406BFB86